MSRMKVILLDANETLLDLAALDLAALDPSGASAFGDHAVRGVWFRQLLQLLRTATSSDSYAPVPVLADAALSMVATTHGIALDEPDRAARHAAFTHPSPPNVVFS